MKIDHTAPVPDFQAAVLHWKAVVARHSISNPQRALFQIAGSFGAYTGLWVLMKWTTEIAWWLPGLLTIPAGLTLLRMFVILHDCRHGVFFESRPANALTGFLAAALTFTPFSHVRKEDGDIRARRETGSAWSEEVKRWLEARSFPRLAAWAARHPATVWIIAPLFVVVIRQRFCPACMKRVERRCVWILNATLAVLAMAMAGVFGWREYVSLQLLTLLVAATAGLWLFRVQREFEAAYWTRDHDWELPAEVLQRNPFYRLPRILHWLSGGLGWQNLEPGTVRVPNYNLRRCHACHPMFRHVKPASWQRIVRALLITMRARPVIAKIRAFPPQAVRRIPWSGEYDKNERYAFAAVKGQWRQQIPGA